MDVSLLGGSVGELEALEVEVHRDCGRRLGGTARYGRVPVCRGFNGELPVRADVCVPMLDLATPSCVQMQAAVDAIGELSERRPTLVCCALGYSRSAAAVAAWLIATGRAASVEEAVGVLRAKRPQVVIHAAMAERLAQWAGNRARW